jgi:hypothetical protein
MVYITQQPLGPDSGNRRAQQQATVKILHVYAEITMALNAIHKLQGKHCLYRANSLTIGQALYPPLWKPDIYFRVYKCHKNGLCRTPPEVSPHPLPLILQDHLCHHHSSYVWYRPFKCYENFVWIFHLSVRAICPVHRSPFISLIILSDLVPT